MHDPTTNEHAGYWRDVRRIIDIAEVTPGLPIPSTSATRAVFDYRSITHATDTAEAVATAVLGFKGTYPKSEQRKILRRGHSVPRGF